MVFKDIYNATGKQVVSLINKYPGAYLFLLFIVIVSITFGVTYHLTKIGKIKLGFVNKSQHGFYYDTDNLRIYSTNDRRIARQALLTQVEKAGYKYTMEQISSLSDSMIISLLEPEDDVDQLTLLVKLVIILDPTYKAVQTSVIKARGNHNKFNSNNERKMVFDLLTKYFVATNTPIIAPLSNWSDYLLIKTFTTLKPPTKTELTPSPSKQDKTGSYDANSAFAIAATSRGNINTDAMTVTPSPLFNSVGSV